MFKHTKNKNGSKFLYRYSSQLVSPRISEYVFSLRVIIKYYIGGHDAVQQTKTQIRIYCCPKFQEIEASIFLVGRVQFHKSRHLRTNLYVRINAI